MISIRVRLFAMQRQQLGVREVALEVPEGSTVAGAFAALAALHPVIAPAGPTLRFARNAVYADPSTRPRATGMSWRSSRRSPVARRSRMAPPPTGASSCPRRPSTTRCSRSSAGPWPRRRTAPSLLFLGQTRATPGTPAPGQEAEAARHAGRTVQALDYEAFEPMALAVLEPGRRRDRGTLRGHPARHPPPHRRGAAGGGERRHRGRRRAPRARRSRPAATRSRSSRRGRPSGSRSASRTAASGSAPRRAPAPSAADGPLGPARSRRSGVR